MKVEKKVLQEEYLLVGVMAAMMVEKTAETMVLIQDA